ncbi:hypothetical protein NQ314_015571 [Rhamnusium bicolor]|uniref:Uncharacterized protein n=1 Tax=Rhamnusium bicolor TaxID=1586634 RepID=A0AAV8WZ33_9CUCU|nr:hypothetical protein NQ314_015571 [Rhamnusium bicolor]
MITPPPLVSTSRGSIQKILPKKILEHQDMKEPVMVLHSPDEKQLHVNDIMDYDDDNNTVLSAEVSLSSAAQQNDADDIVEIETLSQNDLGEGLSSPLESDQIPDEYLLFPGNMVVEEEAEEEYTGENMHIVIRSPTTSDDEFIMQGKTKKYNIVHHPDHLLSMTDTPDSPEQEDMNVDPSPEPGDEEILESEILIIDPNAKSPEDSISTKEDFEELIDEGSRKDHLRKRDVITTKHFNEFHKYANIFNYTKNIQTSGQTISTPNTSRIANVVTQKLPPKISLITNPIMHNLSTNTKATSDKLILAQNTKVINTTTASKLTSIILTHNSAVRGNVLNVPKIVSTVSPAITIVSASTSQIGSILPSKFTVPVISASAVRQLPNVKVIDKPSTSLSLTTHDSSLPKNIFEDDSVSPDSSNFEDDKSKDSSDEKSKSDSPTEDELKHPMFPKTETAAIERSVPKQVLEAKNDRKLEEKFKEVKEQTSSRKVEHLQITNLVTKEQVQKQRVPSPIISKTSSPVIIHNTPELKMTAQVIQETQTHMQITATTETVDAFDGSIDDTKSVVISIPSPTPSQEQMLDNIAMQALENRRREFESFEDVLDMIENITAEPPAILEENVTVKEQFKTESGILEENKKSDIKEKIESPREQIQNNKIETQVAVNVSTNNKSSVVPQLSPLSQPTDLTTNMANASQQLRTLLSSLQTTSTSAPTNVESIVKNIDHKIISSASPTASSPIVASRIIQQPGRQSPVVTSISTVIVPNMKQKAIVSTTANPPRNSPIRTQHISIHQLSSATTSIATTSTLSFLPSRTIGGIHLMPDHPKLPPVTTVISSQQNTTIITAQSNIQKNSVASNSTTTSESRKPSLTLTAMLQNQPAATMTTKLSADTITAASLLGSPISLSRTGFTTALVQAQPNFVVSPITTNSAVSQSPINMTNLSIASVITTPSFRPVTSTTNLLHTQLTKVVRTKSMEEPKEIKVEEIKQELTENAVTNFEDKHSLISIKQELTGCKYSSIPTPTSNRTEDSQNVLLKKTIAKYSLCKYSVSSTKHYNFHHKCRTYRFKCFKCRHIG